jgi:membrane-associated phospholipid phosphatase
LIPIVPTPLQQLAHRINWSAARTSAFLSILFLVVYGATNRLTGLRSDVPSVYFEWERHTPFIPLIFIPYVSIDLLFIIAPFLARTDRQRRTLASRLAAATILGGLCFLLFPLRFAFDRPPVDGLLGMGFDAFRQMDQPFNQCPSLHVALAAILLPEYLRRFKGVLGLGIALWFVLIVLSAVLTWQHHIIDVAGGFALATLCFYLFQDEPLRKPVTPNRRIAMYYGAGAVILVALALLTRPWSLLFLVPAFSLALTTAAYLTLGPGIYRKHNGRVTPLTWLFLWPTLIGQRISLARYTSKSAGEPWNNLTDQILIGRRLNTEEAQRVIAEGATATLDLTGELNEAPPLAASTAYLNLPILDLTAPTPEQLAQAIAFIDSCTGNPSAKGRLYIHCKLGYSRTAAITGAWLLHARCAATPDEAIATLRAARPGIIIRPEAEAVIRASCASTGAER